MEAGVVLLLLVASLGMSSTATFYGDNIHFLTPQKTNDETFVVTFYRRQNGRSSCQEESSFKCDGDVCMDFEKSGVLQTDKNNTGDSRWCQSEERMTATINTKNPAFSLTDSGCCWESNIGKITNWTSHTQINLGTRSDTQSLNSCPVTTTVSFLRVPQNCFSRLRLLAHDPDGDNVRCHFAADTKVPSGFTLNEMTCILTRSGEIQTGIHVFEMMLEDFPSKDLNITYADGQTTFQEASSQESPPLCKVKLQFSVQILPPISSCEIGHVQPVFLSKTPSHGDILHATVGEKLQLYAEAQALHSRINDFQVSGPQNMSKDFKGYSFGKAGMTLSWTPQHSDLYRHIPICFTAETKETQSEMRCVVVVITHAFITQGKAVVQCFPNKMVVALEKASMPGIDVNFLKLRDPTCSLSSNSSHIMGSMSLKTCGTELEDKGDFIVFKNEINSFELNNTIITRRKTIKIGFSCQFPKSVSISSYYNLHESDYIFTESSFGSFSYAFDIYRDANFTNKVEASAYPVEVKLMEKIFMGIAATSELPSVMLFVESCKATPDDNPENSLSYDLIKNGCVKDETFKEYKSAPSEFKFEVQSFKFTGNYDQVYITCSVILCEAGSPFSRCAQGCLKDPSRRRRRELSKETDRHYITQGPLHFIQQSQQDKERGDQNTMTTVDRSMVEGWKFKALLSSNITTIVFASAFLVAVVMLALLVRHYSKKTRPEDTNALILDDQET